MATPIEVTDADFQERVLDRSVQVPVVVDFWADWCRPCHMLAPVIEQAVDAHPGKVELAKLDTDANQATAARYGIRGLPTVKAFRDGRVVDEFTGAQPPPVVERFVDGLVPSEADELVAGGDEESLRRALEVDPAHPTARRELARLLLRRGEPEEALALVDGTPGDFEAEGLAARARLSATGDALEPAF
jgi:putative thioredoxin